MIYSPTLLSLNQLIISPGSTCDKSLHCYDNCFRNIAVPEGLCRSKGQIPYNLHDADDDQKHAANEVQHRNIKECDYFVCAKTTERSKICTNYGQ